jgi:predicted nucleic acid-binding protein
MFDTMEYDRLLGDVATFRRLIGLLTEARVELLTTHIQRDEIMAMKHETKKPELLSLLGHAGMIETRGWIWGLSRWSQARFGRDEDHNIIDQVRGNRWDRDTEDSLIAATASSDADTLVTDDSRFIKRLIDTHIRCDVIGFDEFKSRLEQMET